MPNPARVGKPEADVTRRPLGQRRREHTRLDVVVVAHLDQVLSRARPLGRPDEPPAGLPEQRADPKDIVQLKIRLDRYRPQVWRRILIPAGANLELLHHAIQVTFQWGGDHLHKFTVEETDYSHAGFELYNCLDERESALHAVLARPGSKICYLYDFGDCWNHTITWEKTVERDAGLRYPHCASGGGDYPIEYWDPDSDRKADPFDRDALNVKLRCLTRMSR
ncbi:plasmid pRiA4b ORF-3 family protein [Pseudonocardia sp. GCM10023141]|uniref:plasmid pRiA4b ORF-3 family protein n=1 Tax=Pseudonocardia sp. GCM10023141 TaxID=3252653 RepID=UPI0036086E7C